MRLRWYAFFGNGVEVGGQAAVFAVAVVLLQIPGFYEICNRPFDGGAGEAQVGGDGVDARPALTLGVGAVTEVHIHGPCPVGKLVGGVDALEISHYSPPPPVLGFAP